MDAKEFRLDNYIMHNGIMDTISEIGQCNNGFTKIEGYFNFDEKSVMPIPLTENWLFKFGYVLTPSGTYLHPNSGNFIWFEKDMKCSIAGEFYPIDIKYVHQLQNLYFALTGKELIIKL